jgi:DNA-binding SARP family transcriptional activator
MLSICPGELDVLSFESLVRQGRTRLDGSDWAAASLLLAQAEALWRGTPLADVPSRAAHDRYIRYLEQARLTAMELRVEADVRTSRHSSASVIPELQYMTVLHPERERLVILLMLALYRSGRQAEALDVFYAARRFSTTEYGVDPGPELIIMHKRLLAQDPSLLGERLDRSCFT